MYRDIAAALRDMGADLSKVNGFQILSEDQLREAFISDIPHLAKSLFKHVLEKHWVLFEAAKPLNFWVSDNPIARDNNFNPGDGIRGTSGVANIGIEIYLPISSHLTLGLLCPTIGQNIAGAAYRSAVLGYDVPVSVSRFLTSLRTGRPIPSDKENVIYFNSLQVVHAERYVCSEYNNFDLATQMLSENPVLAQGPRVHMSGGAQLKNAQ